MTLIVGCTHRKRTWLAGDARMSDKRAAIDTRTAKVWSADGGGVVLGIAGDIRGRLALSAVEWRASPRWIDVEATDLIRNTVSAHGLELSDFNALIGCGGRLWLLDSGQVYEASAGYAAIGAGELFGLGWLSATDRGWNQEERLRRCIITAAQHCPAVGGKPTIVCTK